MPESTTAVELLVTILRSLAADIPWSCGRA